MVRLLYQVTNRGLQTTVPLSRDTRTEERGDSH